MPAEVEKIKKIISNQLNIELEDIRADSSFVDDLGADSIDMVEIVMAVENEFNIDIPESEARKISTVDDFFRFTGTNKR